jgi:hypothetical protein
MALLFENYPFVQVCIPRENWRLLMGYEDKTLFLTEDMESQAIMRQVVSTISGKFDIPVVDYTYADQTGIVMYLKPSEVNLPFADRAVRFPDILILGESPDDKTIFEEIISSRKKSYVWTTFTWHNIIHTSLMAGSFAALVALGFIGVDDCLIDVKFMGENRNIYNLILVIYLGSLAYSSSIKKTLTLDADKITYTLQFFGRPVIKEVFEIPQIREVRLKPSTNGFLCQIMDDKRILSLRTHAGGLNDFVNLLWLTEKVQDFILENRGIQIEEELPVESEIEKKEHDEREPASEDFSQVQEKPEEDRNGG